MSISHDTARTAMISLEAAAASARSGFACLFSTSDEYEMALINQRRAEGRYAMPRRRWPMVAFIGVVLSMAGSAIRLL